MVKKVIKIYNNLNIGVKASFWFTFCNFFQKGISMLSIPIFTRLMNTEQYGMYSVYQSWYSILTIIVTLNLFAGVYNRGLVKYEDDRNGFTSSMLGLSFLATLVFFIVYLLKINFWTKVFELNSIYMITMFCEMLFVPAYLYWSARQRFEYKYITLVIVTIIVSLISPIIGIIAVKMSDNKAVARVLSYAVVQICVGIVFFIYIISKGKKIYVKDYWTYALGFNLPLIPHYLSQIVLNQADRIMISRIIGTNEAAIYSVAYNISLIMSLLTNAINLAFVPSLFNSLKSKKYENVKKNSTYIVLIAAGLTFVAILLGPELIKIFAPVEYYDAIWIIPPVSMSVYFIAVYGLFVNIEFYYEKTSYAMYVSVTGALINILLNWLFITKYGYMAAGYTTVFCYILFTIGHYLMYKYLNKRYLNKVDIVNTKIIFLISVSLIILMFLGIVLYNFLWLRYFLIMVLIIIGVINRNKILNVVKLVMSK